MVATVCAKVAADVMRFGHWTLRSDGWLASEGAGVQLPPKELQVLHLLLASAERLVSKDLLLERVWSQGGGSEESLTRCICSLRRYLKADKGYIKTVYGKGYRFACPVTLKAACPTCGQVAV